MAAYTAAILFGLLVFLPWIPGLNKLPRLLPLHRVIWRDWYKRLEAENACGECPFQDACKREFRRAKIELIPGFTPACYRQRDSERNVPPRHPVHRTG